VLKSRGMAHSNQICEFSLNDRGLHLTDDARVTTLAGAPGRRSVPARTAS